MTSRLQKASRFSITALFITFGVAMLALLLPTGWKLFSVQSGSMEPALSRGDLVLVDSVPAPEYRVGDVITYADPDNPKQTITHRIADIREGQQRVFITQGDANARTDRPFNQAMVVGRQEVAIPYAGHAIDFLLTVPGLILMIWLPAMWIIVGETKRLTDYYRRMQKYIAPGFIPPQIIRPSYGHTHHKPVAVAAVSIALIAMAGLSGTVLAAVSSTATLTGNTISIAGDGIPEPPPPTTCTNSNNVNVSSNTNQTATSGSAQNSGNQSGGSATSGNASNSSSTSVNVNINNSCPT